jgi:predicted alpha/beta superfamily hydrolase/L-ascorbate metabolism protein UlaG (beta-lactamase superfamily)
VEVPFGYRVAVESRYLGGGREVFIRLPRGYADQEGPEAPRYPVLYLLDGDDYFQSFAGVVDYMTMYEAVPPTIVVAVPHADRMNELTFTPANEEYGDWPTSGGAEVFEKFLAEELIPAIDANYRTYPFRILAGHSLGGLFAIESMARSPELFQATIAISPSFTWNQYEWLDQAESMFEGRPGWKHFLFVTEEPKSDEHLGRMWQFGEMIEAESPPGFEYWHESFPDENHGTVGLPGFYSSLKKLFDGWTLLGEAWEIGPERVQAHYQSLSDRYGFAMPIPEEYLVDHALHGLQRHEAPDEAIALLELCLSLYPESADAYEALGEAYEWKGETDEAEKHYLKALELDPDHELAKQKLEALVGSSGLAMEVLPKEGSQPEALRAETPRTEAAAGSAALLTVWYLGHCGFAVQVGQKLLVFDYLTDRGTPSQQPDAGGLADGVIEPADLEGLDVYVFVSHAHSDHYDPAILAWEAEVADITYFFGWDADDNPEHHYLAEPRATAVVDGLEVYTIYSHHDTVPEVAYLVHLDGRWIYHNGDYRQDYIADYQYLQTLTDHLDLVFIVGAHDERWQYTHQVHYLLEHFHPEALFPMHRGGEEEGAEDFPAVMAERGYEAFIPVPRRRGDSWVVGG